MSVTEQPVHDEQGHVDGVADMTNGYLPLVSTLNAAKRHRHASPGCSASPTPNSPTWPSRAEPDQPGPVLVAYLDGERTPNRPGASGLLTGLTTQTSREELARAAFEGVVFGLYAGQQHLERVGVGHRWRVIAVGGGARSAAYTQILADIVGQPVLTADAPEATARGAAVQAAAVASGQPVTAVRDAWAPPTDLVAEPRQFPAAAWDTYQQAAAVTVAGSTMTAEAVQPGDGAVRVSAWHAEHPPFAVGGSVYALPGPLRLAGCRSIDVVPVPCPRRHHHRPRRRPPRCHLHRAAPTIRGEVPAARLDLHLIALSDPRVEDEQQALQAAADLAADAITLTPAAINRHRTQVEQLRATGVQVWAEVPPTHTAADVPDHVDAALVMLIEPGTTNAADLTQLDKISDLARNRPVGVDGGVTRFIAPDCRLRGATYLVSGRGPAQRHPGPQAASGCRPRCQPRHRYRPSPKGSLS